MSNNPHFGSSLSDFLIEEGIYEEAHKTATKRVLVWQLEQCMQEQGVSKTELASRMHTSRSAVDRLLDVENDSSTLQTLKSAASSLGQVLEISLGMKI